MVEYYLLGARRPKLNLLLYADPGVGKTTLAAQAQLHPELADALIINVEGGLLSVQDQPGLTAVDVKTAADMEAVFYELIKGEEGKLGNIRTVIIDSVSDLQAQGLEQISAARAGSGRSSKEDVDDIDLKDYGKSTVQLRRLLRMFRDAPLNLVITALTRQKQSDGGTITEVRPELTAKLATSVMGFVDSVWFMYADEDGGRHLLTQPHGPYFAKTRNERFAAAIGDVIDVGEKEPTLPGIYETLKDSVGFDADAAETPWQDEDEEEDEEIEDEESDEDEEFDEDEEEDDE